MEDNGRKPASMGKFLGAASLALRLLAKGKGFSKAARAVKLGSKAKKVANVAKKANLKNQGTKRYKEVGKWNQPTDKSMKKIEEMKGVHRAFKRKIGESKHPKGRPDLAKSMKETKLRKKLVKHKE